VVTSQICTTPDGKLLLKSRLPSGENASDQFRALRSGWTRVANRLEAMGSSFGPASGGRTVISWVVGATVAPFQASNERVMVAVPAAAASGTRTGPWKRTPQHRSLISHLSRSGDAPGLAGGRETSATGFAVAGTVPS
jgi:hypothetical protein